MIEDGEHERMFLVPTSDSGIKDALMYEGDGFIEIEFPSSEFWAVYDTALDDLCGRYDQLFDDYEEAYVDEDIDYILDLAKKYADDSPSFLKAAKLAKEYGYGLAFYM